MSFNMRVVPDGLSLKSTLVNFCCAAIASVSLIVLCSTVLYAKGVFFERERLAKTMVTSCDSGQACEPKTNQPSRGSQGQRLNTSGKYYFHGPSMYKFFKLVCLVFISTLPIEAHAVFLQGVTSVTEPLPASCSRTGGQICRPLIALPITYERVAENGNGSSNSEADILPKNWAAGGCTFTWTHIGWLAKGQTATFDSSPNTPISPIYDSDGVTELTNYYIASRVDICTDPDTGQVLSSGIVPPSIQALRMHFWDCPPGYGSGVSPTTKRISYCKLPSTAIDVTNNSCQKNGSFCGDPVNVGSGNAFFGVNIFSSRRGHANLDLKYNSTLAATQSQISIDQRLLVGSGWTHEYQKALAWDQLNDMINATRDNGDQVMFYAQGNGIYMPLSGRDDFIKKVFDTSGQAAGWAYYDVGRSAIESYDQNGIFTTKTYASGGWINFNYAAGALASVTDEFGRSIGFASSIDASSGRYYISTATDEVGQQYTFGYDAYFNLIRIVFPDGFSRSFDYTANSSGQISAIYDESGVAYDSFSYWSGYALTNSMAGGVQKYQMTYSLYSTPPYSSYTDPLGLTEKNSFTIIQGSPYPSVVTLYDSAGNAIAARAKSYDNRGNIVSETDFNGNETCHGFDPIRNFEIVRVEGLSSATGCDLMLSPGSALPEISRKITSAWHPDWALKTQEASPKKISTWLYNGQVDPIAGTTASCAPSTALLPDGKPIAVLCTHYEQATTDATGALGLSATVTGATRTWTYTYNQYGQVLTETTPKQSSTDTLSHTTTYSYYAATSFSGSAGYTMGDLYTVTNPLGQVTTYTSYDKAGRLLSSTDANKTVTSTTYWPRGWLHTTTVTPAAGTALTTTYDYWPTGLLKTVTMPDASTLNYTYDYAHRLTDVVDGAGNKVHYVLDNMGNRTSEQVSDASGNLAGTVARVYDALNRVQTTTGALH
jgi:YD repeat-containing protein